MVPVQVRPPLLADDLLQSVVRLAKAVQRDYYVSQSFADQGPEASANAGFRDRPSPEEPITPVPGPRDHPLSVSAAADAPPL